MAWHVEPSSGRGLDGLDLSALGIPTLDEYIAMYCERSGVTTADVLRADWAFYMAYNLFRGAAIAQGIAKRVEAGTASSAQAHRVGASVAPRAEQAWAWAQRA
jgi:aminoglycoside phosphotransferase (APT) family kinase protein